MMGATVMVVEDEAGIREVVAEILALQGYEVTTAGNGLEALTQLRRAAALPDAILLDITMPVMDGIAFRRAQLGDPRLAAIPVIVASALAPLAEIPASAQLQKPFGIDDLLGALASQLHGSPGQA
jgi:CheY-like chemotaxis protein